MSDGQSGGMGCFSLALLLSFVTSLVGVVLFGAVVSELPEPSAVSAEGKFDYSTIPQSTTEDGAQVLGNPDAPVTIVEFADFMCPACQQYSSTMERVIEDFVLTGQAKVEYRYFLTVDRTGFVATSVICAVEEGANFWMAHDVMYDLAAQGGREIDARAFAQRLGLDYANLLDCVAESSNEQIVTDIQLGQQAGVTGTPGIRVRFDDGPLRVLAPQFESGGVPYEAIRALVEKANAPQ